MRKKNLGRASMKAGFFLLSFLAVAVVCTEGYATPAGTSDPPDKKDILKKAYRMQVPFIANEGQVDKEVSFFAKTFGGTLFITQKGEMVYSLPFMEETKRETADPGIARNEERKGWVLRERILSGMTPRVEGANRSATKVNFFIGNDQSKWKNNVPTYDEIRFGEVYKGVTLKLRAYGNNVEKIFSVNPGSRPETIRLTLEGARSLAVNKEGELEIKTELGTVTFSAPIAYQERQGGREPVKVAYRIEKEGYGFKVGDYDRERPLVIDPLLASTFIGGSNIAGFFDHWVGIALGNTFPTYVYLAGRTDSNDFPTTVGAYDEIFNGNDDVFVSKLNPNLLGPGALSASTYIGGTGDEWYFGHLTLDNFDNVYICGDTPSADYPTTGGAYDTIHGGGGGFDQFISKLSPTLGSLTASTFQGGAAGDGARGITWDSAGFIYVTGYGGAGYPTTVGAYDTTNNGGNDVVVTRMEDTLMPLPLPQRAATYIGGSYEEVGQDILMDGADVYVIGNAKSGYPTLPGAFDTSHGGGGDPFTGGNFDAFVSKLPGDLSVLTASTFLGGAGIDWGWGAVLDGAGSIYVAGDTQSSLFPTSPGAYDTTLGGTRDAFVARLPTTLGGTLGVDVFSTFLGGGSNDNLRSIALDGFGNVFVAGFTSSSDFPTTPGAYDTTYSNGDVFVSRLRPDMSDLLASTFLGGGGSDWTYYRAIVPDGSGNVFIAGQTNSVDFPTTPGAYDTTYNGGSSDVFISRLTLDLGASPLPAVFVNADNPFPPGDGLSWKTGYTTIQAGVNDAFVSGLEVWVKGGTYNESVTMANGVDLYGGFITEAETMLSQRDWLANTTIIDASPVPTPNHAVIGANGTIDGFTITGGNANGAVADSWGGGMLNDGVSPTVANCTFDSNTAVNLGGGMFNRNNNPTITNCIFDSNTVTSASSYGGGMYNIGTVASITGCTFNANVAFLYGGGMANRGLSSPTIDGCSFQSNNADYGGAMANGGLGGNPSPTINACEFFSNWADLNAGAVDNAGINLVPPCSPTFTNCVFFLNDAFGAPPEGTTMRNQDYCTPTLLNCTFSDNGSAGAVTGTMFNTGSVSTFDPTLINCIMWNNFTAAGEIENSGAPNPAISYCDIEGSLPLGVWDISLGTDFGNNIDADPVFTAGIGDYHLQQPGSPCIDTGNNGAPGLPATDFEGDPRVTDGDGDSTATVDMGADETPTGAAITWALNISVDPTGVGAGAVTSLDGFIDCETLLCSRDYPDGTPVELTAAPLAGYSFDFWEETNPGGATGIDGSNNPVENFTMAADIDLTAHFIPVAGNTLTVSINPPGSGSVTLNPPGGVYAPATVVTLTANPGAGFQFNGWAGDGGPGAVPGTWEVTMNADRFVTANFSALPPPNSPPSLNPVGNKTISEGSFLAFNVSAFDPDGDPLSYWATGLPAGASFSGQSFSWQPDYTQAGTYPVTFWVSDGLETDSETITITVVNVNRAPTLTPIGNKRVNEGESLVFDVNATDPDGDSVALSVDPLPEGATFNGLRLGQTFSWTPDYTQAGTYAVTFSATDGTESVSEEITITVVNVTDPPVLNPIGDKTINEGQNLTFTISASDPDQDPLTFSAAPLPLGASFTGATFSWTPNYTQAGTYQVTFSVSDGFASDSEEITITVTDNNAPQIGEIGTIEGNEGDPLSFEVLATDPEGDPLTYEALNLPAGAVFNTDTGAFVWTPALGQAGTYEVEFRVSDGEFTETVIVTIEVAISYPALPEDPEEGLTPSTGATGENPEEICFTWPEARYAESYDLIVAEDGQFTMVVLEVHGLTEPHYCVGDPAPSIMGGGLEPYRSYYWRVVVHNRNGEAEYPGSGFATGGTGEGGNGGGGGGGNGEPSGEPITMNSPPFIPFADVVYQKISVPLHAEDKHPLAILGDDLGPYIRSEWRLFRYDSSDGQYHEYPHVPPMEPGLAYWLVAKERVEFDAVGWPASTEGDFVIRIPPGFCQLGCPFFFPVSWDEVQVRYGNVTAPIGDPLNEWISPVIQTYENGGYVNADVLKPWEGYWVENVSTVEVELLIPPIMHVGGLMSDRTAQGSGE